MPGLSGTSVFSHCFGMSDDVPGSEVGAFIFEGFRIIGDRDLQ